MGHLYFLYTSCVSEGNFSKRRFNHSGLVIILTGNVVFVAERPIGIHDDKNPKYAILCPFNDRRLFYTNIIEAII